MDDLEVWFQNSEYQKHWTLPQYKPSKAQIRIFKEIDAALKQGYKKIVIHAGVGLGKSAIATTLMRKFESSFILTKDTQLQDQYIDDYFEYLVELKGRSHYECQYGGTCDNCYINYVNEHKTPDLAVRLELLNTHGRHFEFPHPLDEILDGNYIGDNDKAKKYWEKISEMKLWYCDDCEYLLARKEAKENNHIIANYHSLYFNSLVYHFFDKRESIFFDECHNIEKLLSDWFTISISPYRIYKDYGIDVFEDKLYSELDDVDYWISIFQEIILKLILLENEEISKYKSILDDNYLDNIKKDYAQKKARYQGFIDLLQEEYCVMLPSEEDIYDDSANSIKLQPVFCKNLANDLFEMGEVNFFLSGTLPNYKNFFNELGVPDEDIYYIHEESPYLKENRPIIFKPLGNFSSRYNHYENGRLIYAYEHPSVITGLKEILDNHHNENIIIFTESNDQTDYLCDELDEYNPLPAYADFKDDNLELFKQEDDCNLLISPSISEGVDFKGDSCTVQIIFKIPYPVPIGRIKTRLNKYKDWNYYNALVLIKLEQMYGRSIRGVNDKCITYIVDSAFNNLLTNCKFSNYFSNGLKVGEDY